MEYDYDVAIIGAGAAGMSAAVYSGRSGNKTVLFDKDTPGGQTLLSPAIENYVGFKKITGPELCDLMADHAREYCDLKELEEVLEIERLEENGEPSGFRLKTDKGEYVVGVLILAMGAHHKHLGVPGEKELSGKGVSSCATCDGYFFKGKKAVMVGGGNSAALEAIFLHGIGVETEIIHRRDQLRAEAAYVKQIQEAGIKIHWNAQVKEIHGNGTVQGVQVVDTKTGEERKLDVDAVFIAIGIEPSTRLAKSLGVTLRDDGYITADPMTMETNVPRVYACGDVLGGARQIATGVGQGCIAALQANKPLGKAYPF
ncbi:MAG: FAD-dependent oxidoreductase [Euryarchaeota archaeon]|nr:FAD-dependent oxidoreductase [Euryarchaeota archaeon]